MTLLFFATFGTVPDWSMVIVTSITAYYLYKTLQSQKEVQRTQNELYKIESIRFKESIKPVLKYSGSTGKMKPSEETKKIFTIEVTNETSSTALEICKIISEKSEQTTQIIIPTGFSDTRNHLVKGDAPLLFHFLIDEANKVSEWVIFSLTYQDIAGTKYKQHIFSICDHYGIEIHPSLPEIID